MAATGTLISVEEYLRTSADPDCEYVSGVLEERTVGELDHANWQKALVRWFLLQESDWGIRVYPELRVQVAPDRFRVPDVTLLSRSAPREQIVTHAPLAVFEILSPEDAMARTLEKLADYERMGIEAIWVIEPRSQSYYRFHKGQLGQAPVFELPGSSFRVAWTEIAALLD
ncbi:MAG: Uma2 family endonuclease [Terracidiphilus sp.]